MNDETPRHPEIRIMTAFIDGTLPPDGIAEVAGHLQGCADCRTVVAETVRFEREEEALFEAQRPARSKRHHWLAVAAALGAIALTAPLLLRWNDNRRAPIARLIAIAPRSHRAVEPRLSGFPWARLQAPSRGVANPDPADLKLGGVAGEVLEQSEGKAEPEARRASGVAYLLIGRRAESLAALEQAAQDSRDARTWNDLAAAHYVVAVEDERPSELPEALAAVDHSLRLDPENAEALFNRALIVERLGVREAARKAWQRYLDIDGSGDWSVEARVHLRALESTLRRFDPKMFDAEPVDALVRQFPQEARTRSEALLLAAWADAEAAGDVATAARMLARARLFADAIARFRGDRFLDDAVTAIEGATGAQRAALANGHRIYRDARIEYSRRRPGAAEPQFRRAAQILASGESPMAEMASYFAASTAFDQGRAGEAREALASLLKKVDSARHRALTAQIRWELTVCANAAGEWGTALREADAAATIFRSLGEDGHAATQDGFAAMALELIGERDLAWSRRLRSIAQLSAMGDRQRLGSLLHASATTLAATGHIAAASAVIDLMIDGDRDGTDTAQLSFGEADVARFAARNGDPDRARDALARARAAAARVADPALRETVVRQIDLADATMSGASNAKAAIASLDRSIAFFTERQASVDLAEAYLQRAKHQREAGNATVALDDVDRAMGVIEQQRETIRDAESRLRFLDVASRIIEESIDLRLSRGDVSGAFLVADRSRALSMSSRDVLRSPSPELAVVEYSVLTDEVIAFCVTSKGLTAQRLVIGRRDLESAIGSLAHALRRRAPVDEVRAKGAALHAILLAPLESRLAGVDELVLVPDRELYALPFAALWDEGRQQYLTETFTIRFAPSATIHRELAARLAPALVIADPPAPPLPRLPFSRGEAEQISSLHGDATVLIGDAATPAAFVAAAGRSALIHFAGHANSDTGGSYAALLFAGSSGVFGSEDIARLTLAEHPLVVLAACGTFRGSTQHVAGMSSLARAFLTAGARAVVGTLWEIDDDVSAPFFLRLHEHLRAGASPARALRQAQVDLLRSSDARLAHPATWAPAESLSND